MALSKLTLVPTPAVKGEIHPITASEITTWEARREHLVALKDEVRKLEAELEAQQQGFIERLKGGAKVARGWVMAIEVKKGAVRPAWKEEFQKLCSRVGLIPSTEVAAVIHHTLPSISEVLVVVKKGS